MCVLPFASVHCKCMRRLELRQYKNNSDQFDRIPHLLLARFFHHFHGKRKKAAISNVEFYQTDRSYSYIVLALVRIRGDVRSDVP